jgi:hypothetical protein
MQLQFLAQRALLPGRPQHDETQHPSSNGGARAVLRRLVWVATESQKIIKKQRAANTDVPQCHRFRGTVAVASTERIRGFVVRKHSDCALCKINK